METEKTNAEPGYWEFESISDFKQCMEWGGEVEFIWKGMQYGVFGKLCETEDGPVRMFIGESY